MYAERLAKLKAEKLLELRAAGIAVRDMEFSSKLEWLDVDGELKSGQQYEDTALEIAERFSKYGEIEVKNNGADKPAECYRNEVKKSLAAPPGRNPVVKDAGKAGRADDRPTAGGTAPTID